MDEPVEPTAPMLSGSDLIDRLDSAASSLRDQAANEAPSGLTDPEPGTDERWEAGQVWAHVAEFIPYWHHQIESVIGEYDGAPVPFGRTKTDPDRLAGIEMGLRAPIGELAARASESVDAAKRYFEGLLPPEWSAVGLHPTRGEMDVEQMVETFLINHLEEHVAQLDGLRR